MVFEYFSHNYQRGAGKGQLYKQQLDNKKK